MVSSIILQLNILGNNTVHHRRTLFEVHYTANDKMKPVTEGREIPYI